MKCPIDGSDLVMTDRQNVEIDYCPKCRGVWLDRGELDKILERAEQMQPAQPHVQQRHGGNGEHYRREHKYKKRESWLSELFD